MKPKLKHEDTLEKAAAGITRVARAVLGLPPDRRQKALGAVERSYREIAMDLGFGESQADGWASAIMVSLRAELEERLLASPILQQQNAAAYPLGRRRRHRSG
jgi:DNA-directed RNA polymerase specialized sigma24 family protein